MQADCISPYFFLAANEVARVLTTVIILLSPLEQETIGKISADERSRLLGVNMGKDAGRYDDSGFFGSRFREWRHNPCLMQPASLVMIVIFAFFMITMLVLQAPTFVLGLVVAPIISRSSWYVEFLYPWDVARWGHFFLIRLSSKFSTKPNDKNRGFHSRTIEQKIEVVKDRVYIHPIPQLLDNLGYLVVCLPKRAGSEVLGAVRTSKRESSDSIVAIMIDCGEASATIRAIEMIQQSHYRRQPFQIQSILSTHKHHDHTGGNLELMKSKLGSSITKVFAGAVEKVPHCTDPLADGAKITLPRAGFNDMNDVVGIEAVAVPAHTRGSLVYRLYSTEPNDAEFMFTGDTMFSGGAGVPFESDIGSDSESRINRSNGNTFVRAGIGSAAMERCFAEILVRGMPGRRTDDESLTEKILIFPGHEYTADLLSRQLVSATDEACRWKNFTPRDFFDTVSHMYVALHRRSLPSISGKLLMIPSTLQRELRISPQFRSLRRSGELVTRAIHFWYEHFCNVKDEVTQTVDDSPSDEFISLSRINPATEKGESTSRRWNVHPEEVSQDIFTTVYTSDLTSVIEDLLTKEISTKEAGVRLRDMTQKLSEPVVNRRAIPGFLPSDKSIYRGIVALVLLGSRPSAMTWTDSRRMNLPPPIDSNSDRILVSKKRLLMVLDRLGLLRGRNAGIARMIGLLWKDVSEFVSAESVSRRYDDVESSAVVDEIELGILKWTLYGVSANQPSWFSKTFCMPCSDVPRVEEFPVHPASKMKRKMGDLVSHDVLTCPISRTATGCLSMNPVEPKCAQDAEREVADEIEVAIEPSKMEKESRDDLDEVNSQAKEDSLLEVMEEPPSVASPPVRASNESDEPQPHDLELTPPGPFPLEPVSVEPIPLEQTSLEPIPLELATLEPATLEPLPVEPIPLQPLPFEPVPLETTSTERIPLEQGEKESFSSLTGYDPEPGRITDRDSELGGITEITSLLSLSKENEQ